METVSSVGRKDETGDGCRNRESSDRPPRCMGKVEELGRRE
jgi:hypothetical protein